MSDLKDIKPLLIALSINTILQTVLAIAMSANVILQTITPMASHKTQEMGLPTIPLAESGQE